MSNSAYTSHIQTSHILTSHALNIFIISIANYVILWKVLWNSIHITFTDAQKRIHRPRRPQHSIATSPHRKSTETQTEFTYVWHKNKIKLYYYGETSTTTNDRHFHSLNGMYGTIITIIITIFEHNQTNTQLPQATIYTAEQTDDNNHHEYGENGCELLPPIHHIRASTWTSKYCSGTHLAKDTVTHLLCISKVNRTFK